MSTSVHEKDSVAKTGLVVEGGKNKKSGLTPRSCKVVKNMLHSK